MTGRAAMFLLLALACAPHAATTRAQTIPAPESQAERALRIKAEKIDRVAETEFDRARESAERRAARARFEYEKGIDFSPLGAEDGALLAPPPEAAARHASFLAQPDTGLVRLLPRGKFDAKLGVRGGGAFYSFAHLVHEYNYGSDIGLEQDGRLCGGSVGAGYAFLFDLGDMPLEEVTTETGPVRFLYTFTPPTAEPEARQIQRRFHDGYQEGWFVYRRYVPAVVGHTYIVRAVDYRMSDVLVVFRVLSQDESGGVVLLWRMLKQFPAPYLQRGAAQPNAAR